MKTLLRLTLLTLCFATAACTGGVDATHLASNNWETMKYSDYAALEPNSLIRMGK